MGNLVGNGYRICNEDQCLLPVLASGTSVAVWGLSGQHFLPGPRASVLHSGAVCRSQHPLSLPLSFFPGLSPILRAIFLVWCTSFFVFWFHHPWNQDSSGGNLIREALQQFISNSKGVRRKLVQVNNPLCFSSLLPAQVPFGTQRS